MRGYFFLLTANRTRRQGCSRSQRHGDPKQKFGRSSWALGEKPHYLVNQYLYGNLRELLLIVNYLYPVNGVVWRVSIDWKFRWRESVGRKGIERRYVCRRHVAASMQGLWGVDERRTKAAWTLVWRVKLSKGARRETRYSTGRSSDALFTGVSDSMSRLECDIFVAFLSYAPRLFNPFLVVRLMS
jgi:hypothetical protein